MDCKSYLKDRWIKSQIEIYNLKGIREDVLNFIWNFSNSVNKENSTTIISELFSNGYCYYFALILRDAFGGEIMWLNNKGHIVWVDRKTMIPYDINGVYIDATPCDLIPLELLGETCLEEFRHRGKSYSENIFKEAMVEVMDNVKDYNDRITKAYTYLNTEKGKCLEALDRDDLREKLGMGRIEQKYYTDLFK